MVTITTIVKYFTPHFLLITVARIEEVPLSGLTAFEVSSSMEIMTR